MKAVAIEKNDDIEVANGESAIEATEEISIEDIENSQEINSLDDMLSQIDADLAAL